MIIFDLSMKYCNTLIKETHQKNAEGPEVSGPGEN
jgi:hypothetical protein